MIARVPRTRTRATTEKELKMTSINTGKVVTGGLVAGVVANVIDFVTNNFVLMADWQAFALDHNLEPEALTSAATAITWVAVDFVLGILLVLTYAAIRPRFGAGAGTAVYAGLILYVATTAVVFGFTMMGLLTMGMFLKGALCAFVSVMAASLVGAAMYKEADDPIHRAAHA
jgi:hypothetical protein